MCPRSRTHRSRRQTRARAVRPAPPPFAPPRAARAARRAGRDRRRSDETRARASEIAGAAARLRGEQAAAQLGVQQLVGHLQPAPRGLVVLRVHGERRAARRGQWREARGALGEVSHAGCDADAAQHAAARQSARRQQQPAAQRAARLRKRRAGKTEEFIGSWLSANPEWREKVVLASKVAGFMPNSRVAAERTVPPTDPPPDCRLDRSSVFPSRTHTHTHMHTHTHTHSYFPHHTPTLLLPSPTA